MADCMTVNNPMIVFGKTDILYITVFLYHIAGYLHRVLVFLQVMKISTHEFFDLCDRR